MDEQNTPAPVMTPPPAPAQSGGTSKNVLMGSLAYIGPLIIVSYLVAKDDPFVKFHIKQGLVLVVISVVVWLFGMLGGFLWMVLNLINLAVLVLAIIGIVNAAQGHEKNLPLVGEYASKFNF